MLTIEYSVKGQAVKDLEAENFARELYQSDVKYHHTATDSLITAFRMLVAEGEFSHEKVVFKFEGERLEMDSLGQLKVFPKGFCDCEKEMLYRLINAKRKTLKE